VLLIASRPAAAAETADGVMKKSKAVLAQLEGEIVLPGLKAPVEVLRDRHGVPHLYAQSADDLFFAQGFVTAQDRLFQMDWWRRVAIGETAEAVGKRGLDGDRFARLVRYRGDMDAEWASYGPDAKAAAVAFTRGINAYIEHLGDRLPIEFQILGYKPAKWKPEDCLGRMAGIVMVHFASEADRAELVATVARTRLVVSPRPTQARLRPSRALTSRASTVPFSPATPPALPRAPCRRRRRQQQLGH
jgi:penicillin amidase